MRELTVNETDATAGGLAISGAIAISMGTTLAGAYVYEKLGGAEGIDKIVKKVVKFIAEASTC